MLVGTDRCKACYGVLIAHTTQANGGPFFGSFAPANQQIVSANLEQGKKNTDPNWIRKNKKMTKKKHIDPNHQFLGSIKVPGSINFLYLGWSMIIPPLTGTT